LLASLRRLEAQVLNQTLRGMPAAQPLWPFYSQDVKRILSQVA